MSARTADPVTDVVLDVDLDQVPQCEGFTDPVTAQRCPEAAEYVARVIHVRRRDTCAIALVCDQHLWEHLEFQRQVESNPVCQCICSTHLLPTKTKAVPL